MLYKEIIPPIFQQIRSTINQWRCPKILYLFRILPIPVPASHLKKLQIDPNFVWNYRWHRIPCTVLMASRIDGGLAFPNLLKFYQVAQLCAVASWYTQCAYNRWMKIGKLWLEPVHPNNRLWNANVEVVPSQFLGAMTQLRTTRRVLCCQHALAF